MHKLKNFDLNHWLLCRRADYYGHKATRLINKINKRIANDKGIKS